MHALHRKTELFKWTAASTPRLVSIDKSARRTERDPFLQKLRSMGLAHRGSESDNLNMLLIVLDTLEYLTGQGISVPLYLIARAGSTKALQVAEMITKEAQGLGRLIRLDGTIAFYETIGEKC
jgi:hypothetical protein